MSRKRAKQAVRSKPQAAANEPPTATPPAAHPRPGWLVGTGLGLLLLLVYGLTMHPGVADADAAELQYMSSLLGVLHPPGYPLAVLLGKVFSLLPVGPDVAWRINLMQVVCGTLGCLALFGALRRLTQQDLPSAIATTAYAFSVVVWKSNATAEVYAFYNMLLLGGVYTAVRFVTERRNLWLYLTAALLGMCVGNRLSELLVMPGIVLFWLVHRKQTPIRWSQFAWFCVIGVTPFLFSIGYCFVRETPAALHARDDALRDEILGLGPAPAELPFGQRLAETFSYCVGGKTHADFTRFSAERMAWDLDKYAWRLSGLGALGDRYGAAEVRADSATRVRQIEQGRGTSVGVLGVLLALLGLRAARRWPGGVLLGWAFLLGNLAFYVYMHPSDNLAFTGPSLAGLCLLIGLGVAHRPEKKPGRVGRGLQLACAAAPLFLLISNWGVVTAHGGEQHWAVEDVRAIELPQDSVIIARYQRANRLRYLCWIAEQRPDIHVFIFRRTHSMTDVQTILAWARDHDRAAVISLEVVRDPRTIEVLANRTPAAMRNVGLFYGIAPVSP